MKQVTEFNFQVARCGNGGHIRLTRKWIGKRVRVTIEEAREPYTAREKEYLQAHKNEIAWDRRLDEMITYLTGKTAAEQGEIIGRTPKTENRRKVLVDESKGHMIKLSKQMTGSHIGWTLNVMRDLLMLGDAFSDILYDEQELRRDRDKILGT